MFFYIASLWKFPCALKVYTPGIDVLVCLPWESWSFDNPLTISADGYHLYTDHRDPEPDAASISMARHAMLARFEQCLTPDIGMVAEHIKNWVYCFVFNFLSYCGCHNTFNVVLHWNAWYRNKCCLMDFIGIGKSNNGIDTKGGTLKKRC